MKRTYLVIIIVLWIALSLVACSGEAPPEPEDAQPQTEQESPVDEPYPAPNSKPIEPSTEQEVEPYPEPSEADSDQPQQEPPLAVPPPSDHEYAPVSGDEVLTRGNVYIDASEIILLESYPVQVELVLIGNLPTPCNQLRAITSPADDQNRIQVEVYSLIGQDVICTQVLEPFEAKIPLGSYTEGSFTVLVNGEAVGSFDLP